MNKYEERLLQRAEELAIAMHGHAHNSPRYLPLARLSVLREAEAYKASWLACDSRDADLDNYTLDELLINSGLIPQNTKP